MKTYRSARSRIVICLVPAIVVDRKSTRLNSSHGYISYAVFCLKKKNINLEKSLNHHSYYLVRLLEFVRSLLDSTLSRRAAHSTVRDIAVDLYMQLALVQQHQTTPQ